MGVQERYPERFASSLIRLYEVFKGDDAERVGSWSTDGYSRLRALLPFKL